MTATKIAQRLTSEQAQGAEPLDNAWMSASAGTGKTEVLSARILRQLLSGVRAQSILAITFTKAGAAEMAWRIREKLAAWVQLNDKDLSKELFAIHAEGHLDKDMLAYARTLFASVIDAPGGGLAIQTIHSFCQSLLASFPEEAGLAPGFRPLEDREIAELQREVLSDLIAGAPLRGEMGFLDRLDRMAMDMGYGPAQAYLFRCAAAQEAIAALPDGLGPWLRNQFGFASDISPDEYLIGGCAIDDTGEDEIRHLIAANVTWGTATGQKYAALLGHWLAAETTERATTIDAILSALLTQKGELRAEYSDPKKMEDAHECADSVAKLLCGLRNIAAQMRACDKLADALDAGRHFARAYATRKRRDGVVDYDDLILHTVTLLESGGQEWIRYKLDACIDHILVDEAQDTNALQWRIVRALCDEFFAGAGTKEDVPRSLFVVGDTKQAIYGFQGTNPIYFEAARERFKRLGQDAERDFKDISIDTNFRSSPPILKLVDRLIAQIGPEQFGLDGNVVNHSAHFERAPGKVTLWPLEPHGRDDEDSSDNGGDAGEEGWIDSATRRIAGKIGRSVRRWLDHGIDGTPVKPSDVMILVRKRSDIAALIVSRLIANDVPVSGVDRLKLRSPIAVQDLLCAIRFALQPHDDLTLANLLTSPLIGWTHSDLIEHGWRMDGEGNFPVSLWRHLNRQPALDLQLGPLHDLLKMAGYASPYSFLETILSGPMQGRARLLARLGHGALDPIEELLSQALAFETRQGASLHRFLAWFDAGTGDIKRELEGSEDAVRVMTVHGAKGLQARIVILADAAGNPAGKRDEVNEWQYDGTAIPLVALKQEECPAKLAETVAAKTAADLKENNRLLYVAATRAERMLFVAGALSSRGELPPGNWYSALEMAVLAIGGKACQDEQIWGSALCYDVSGTEDARIRKPSGDKLDPVIIPAWAGLPAPVETRPLRPLAPSAHEELAELSVPNPPAIAARDAAMQRGTLIHALLERLPATPPAMRYEAAMRWLAARALDAATSEREGMVASVLGVLDDPAFADLFGPDSLAEAPFSALVDGRVIAGTVDRLLVTDSDVRVIDYKSGRFVPASAAEVPVGYLKQMAAYVAALRVIFPAHRVSAALLFSEGPRLIALPDAIIEQYKPKLAEV